MAAAFWSRAAGMQKQTLSYELVAAGSDGARSKRYQGVRMNFFLLILLDGGRGARTHHLRLILFLVRPLGSASSEDPSSWVSDA
jgi:hypothetical protein